jgi:uncharacterized protein
MTSNLLQLNVGFIIHQTIGYSRDFPIEIPEIRLSPDLEVRDLTGVVRVTRTGQGLLLQARLAAHTTSDCARCLTDFQQPLEAEFTELYAFKPEAMTDSGLLLPETGKIDLGSLVREELLLSMPINPVCSPDCTGLCPFCGERFSEGDHNHDEEDIDPRLANLKTLLDKPE